jgi:hypothetical protein
MNKRRAGKIAEPCASAAATLAGGFAHADDCTGGGRGHCRFLTNDQVEQKGMRGG